MKREIVLLTAAACVGLVAWQQSAAQVSLVGGRPPATAGTTQPSQPAAPGPRVVKFNVAPMPEAAPALKHQLLPTVWEQTPGNAALLYYQAMLAFPEAKNVSEEVNRLQDAPRDQLDRARVRHIVDKDFGNALRLVELAVARESCDWAIPFREQGLGTIIPSFSRFRLMARVLSLKARVEIAEGKFDDAVHTLRTQYAMAHHLAEAPFFVTSFVGLAIGQIASNDMEYLIQSDGPNMYWALASLPDPVVDLRRAMEGERGILAAGDFASLGKNSATPADRINYRTTKMTTSQWGQMLSDMYKTMYAMERGAMPKTGPEGLAVSTAVIYYPQAKQYLAHEGYTSDQIEAMPVAQAVLIYMTEPYQHWRDELSKWNCLPYWQVVAGMTKSEKAFEDWYASGGRFNLFVTTISTLSRARWIQCRAQRQVAALKIVEGIRMYAAKHGGAVPESLRDMTDSPAPIDPATGKDFVYRMAARNACTIEAATPAGEAPEQGFRYEISITAPKQPTTGKVD